MTRQSKFFRTVELLERLAQFDTEHPYNANTRFVDHATENVTFSCVDELDAKLFDKYRFTPEMIHFARGLQS